jgi:ABC-type transporter Mla subunit MlaD
MMDQSAAIGPDRVIDILSRACADVGDLAIHLEQTLQNLREVDDHLSRLATAASDASATGARPLPAASAGSRHRITSPLSEIRALLDRANTRAAAIVATLERKVLPRSLQLQR